MAIERATRTTPRRPEPPRPAPTWVTTSWDDGHIFDFAIANLLDDYGLPGTFYIAPRNCELSPQVRLRHRDIAELGSRFEIGGHTLNHLRLTELDDGQAAAEIITGKSFLEDCVGRPVTSFCYPGGAYAPRHTAMVWRAGFALARTIERHRTDRPHALMEVSTSFHAYRHLSDGRPALRMAHGDPVRAGRYFWHWDEWAIALFEQVHRQGGVFHLWGHSWELAARGDWGRLEHVLRHISRRSDVTYITNHGLTQLDDAGARRAP